MVLAQGGNGGWGNMRFATSTNRAPRRANPGQEGVERMLWLRLKQGWLTLYRRRSQKKSAKTAEQMAEDAIRRARGTDARDGKWDGNVYKPKSFKRPPRDKLH